MKARYGVEVNFVGRDQTGSELDLRRLGRVHQHDRAGLRRTDTLWKALGKAAVLRTQHPDVRGPAARAAHHRRAQRSAPAWYKALRAAQYDSASSGDILSLDQPETVAEFLHYASGQALDGSPIAAGAITAYR